MKDDLAENEETAKNLDDDDLEGVTGGVTTPVPAGNEVQQSYREGWN